METVEKSTLLFGGDFSTVSTAFRPAPHTSTLIAMLDMLSRLDRVHSRDRKAGSGCSMTTTVLSEPSALQLYPVVRGGIQ